MKSVHYTPPGILQPYVRSLAIHEVSDERTYRILPVTGLVIGFQYSGRLSHVDGQTEVALSSSGITGLQSQFRIFKNTAHTGTVLVYFKEAGATQFFRQPLHELFRQSISLENLVLSSEIRMLEEQLAEASSDMDRIALVSAFLIARLKPTPPDPLVAAALNIIHQNKGDIRMQELARQLHTSKSPLEKRFRQAVGTSPKKFSGIVRLDNIIKNYTPGVSLTAMGYAAGYFDQSHFIKEFKTFTGETPESYFSSDNK